MNATQVLVRHGEWQRRTEVGEGESWLGAAERLAREAGLPGAPVPGDLGAREKVFVIDLVNRVALRPMVAYDLTFLKRWLEADHVRRWFPHEDLSREALEATYLPRIRGEEATRMWVVEVNGRSVGFVQDYLVGGHPSYALVTPDPKAVGVDFALGERAWLGRGFGKRMLWAWVTGPLRTCYPGSTRAFSAPDHRNTASLRTLEAVGFVQGAWFDQHRPDGSVDTLVGCTLDVRRVVG